MLATLLIFSVALSKVFGAISIKEIKEIIGTNLGYDQSKMKLFSKDVFDTKNEIGQPQSVPYADNDEINSENGVRFLYLLKGGKGDGNIDLKGAGATYKSKNRAVTYQYPRKEDSPYKIRMDTPNEFTDDQTVQFISAIAQFLKVDEHSHPNELSVTQQGDVIMNKDHLSDAKRLEDEKDIISIVIQHRYKEEQWSYPIYCKEPKDQSVKGNSSASFRICTMLAMIVTFIIALTM